ncbi:N-formylglutamate amidohydrolase [Agrobacterium tumefaciens]|uniref:Riorf59 protein n=2 Tax=Rhizobium/Agrobacterium group TaxID=227290 RepID=Q9KWC5_RHIRH|nr:MULTISPECIES: N-formylglutamate amidohydrolase [Rhizobium/Agrobacterium group]ASK42940.1 N-formylglutamate amidohydrolase [Rhizobium rhizogenes]MCZ7977346.1 N-formylglutamate amidohydrolase [Agrobacterium salinitolerans]MDA5243155.1 N-formylglutamate amidohydrolase [Agrobacterium sp. MAFF310724]MDA5247663.1 N-formylglutamate amidohydrolase [Agrobacterium sp. MAFF210268]TRB03332.1 N-formylglutamate amidohydrolase [Agrobacterium tumefaciens]
MGKLSLLAPGESAIAIENKAALGKFVIVCEHASHLIPPSLGDLGLDAFARSSHIAWDPGALELARYLSSSLDAVLYYQRFSRLVYDCNRPPEAVPAIVGKSEIYDVPGNQSMPEADRLTRINEIYLSFRDGLSEILASCKAQGRGTMLVTVHSFTPVYFGKKREVEIGILHDSDTTLADAILAESEGADRKYVVMRNQPYGPADGVTHTLVEHGIANGIPNVVIEVRNDLLVTADDQAAVGSYLSRLIGKAASTVKAGQTVS